MRLTHTPDLVAMPLRSVHSILGAPVYVFVLPVLAISCTVAPTATAERAMNLVREARV